MLRRHAVLFIVLTALGFGLRRVWAQCDRKLGPAEVSSAFDDFQVALDERWSYRHAHRADFDAAIAALRLKAAAGMSIDGSQDSPFLGC